eukprot:gene25170-31599_t
MLVGIGPGSTEHMTARARAAIAEADTIIGYVTYIKLVADLIEGKEIIRKSMTEELDRAIEALARAREGKKVALISSGDAGVYGMAGPTFEVLFQAGWTPPAIDENGEPEAGGIVVEVVPGALLGVLAAWRGGRVERTLVMLADAVLAIPGLLLVLLIAALAPGQLWALYVGMATALWVEYFRVCRAMARPVLAGDAVQASRLLGFGQAYVLRRHLLPALTPTLGTLLAFTTAQAVLALAALGFVGVGNVYGEDQKVTFSDMRASAGVASA